MEPRTYEISEQLAMQTLHNWRFAQAQAPHIFQTAGFPIRVDTTQDLYQLLDTMQEYRFERYMNELNGLKDGEIELLVDILVDHCLFQKSVFPARVPQLALATILAHFALFKKIEATGDFARTLELGPGCGYLSYFMKRYDGLEKFVQTESAQSFYVLQNKLLHHLFGPAFHDHAYLDYANLKKTAIPTTKMVAQNTASNFGFNENQLGVDFVLPAVAEHYPWWQVGLMESHEFDLVTSNANLQEFRPEALRIYLDLIHKTLKPEGLFLVQCLGSPVKMKLDELFQQICEANFAVVMMVPDGPSARGKDFVVWNALFVRDGHPLHEKFYSTDLSVPKIPDNEDIVEKTFFPERSNTTRLDKAELSALVVDALRDRFGSNSDLVRL